MAWARAASCAEAASTVERARLVRGDNARHDSRRLGAHGLCCVPEAPLLLGRALALAPRCRVRSLLCEARLGRDPPSLSARHILPAGVIRRHRHVGCRECRESPRCRVQVRPEPHEPEAAAPRRPRGSRSRGALQGVRARPRGCRGRNGRAREWLARVATRSSTFKCAHPFAEKGSLKPLVQLYCN